MKNIEYLKRAMSKGVDEELRRMSCKLEEVREDIECAYSIPDLISQFPVLYGNSLEQRYKMIEVLPRVLNADFFKRGKIFGKSNSIVFELGEYAVSFPTFHAKTIDVVRKNSLQIKSGPLPLKQEVYKIAELWDSYQLEKDRKTFAKLVSSYSILTRGVKSSYLFKRSLKIEDIEEFVGLTKEDIDTFERKTKEWEKHLQERESAMNECEDFMESIKSDLVGFKKSGWTITYENFQGLEEFEV